MATCRMTPEDNICSCFRGSHFNSGSDFGRTEQFEYGDGPMSPSDCTHQSHDFLWLVLVIIQDEQDPLTIHPTLRVDLVETYLGAEITSLAAGSHGHRLQGHPNHRDLL